jgi:hypothetical protein
MQYGEADAVRVCVVAVGRRGGPTSHLVAGAPVPAVAEAVAATARKGQPSQLHLKANPSLAPRSRSQGIGEGVKKALGLDEGGAGAGFAAGGIPAWSAPQLSCSSGSTSSSGGCAQSAGSSKNDSRWFSAEVWISPWMNFVLLFICTFYFTHAVEVARVSYTYAASLSAACTVPAQCVNVVNIV